MRTFIALEIPESFRFEVAALARGLGEFLDGRFTDPANYHVTLAFLGDASRRDVEAAADALDAVCAGSMSMPLKCDGLGKFGKSGDATLWLALEQSEALGGLASAVRDELERRSVTFDNRPFKAHVTLARHVRIPKAAMPPLPFPASAYARAITLFKSELDSSGPTYTPLHTVAFGVA